MKKFGFWILLLVLTIVFLSCFNGESKKSDNGNSTPQTYEWVQEIDTIQGTLSVSTTNGRHVWNDGTSVFDQTITMAQNYTFSLHKNSLYSNVWSYTSVAVSGSFSDYELVGLMQGNDAYLQDSCNCSEFISVPINLPYIKLTCNTDNGTCTLQFNGGQFSNCVVTSWDIINEEYLLGPDEPTSGFDGYDGTIKNIPLLSDDEIYNGTNKSESMLKAESTLIGQMQGIDQIYFDGYGTGPLANATWKLNAYIK